MLTLLNFIATRVVESGGELGIVPKGKLSCMRGVVTEVATTFPNQMLVEQGT